MIATQFGYLPRITADGSKHAMQWESGNFAINCKTSVDKAFFTVEQVLMGIKTLNLLNKFKPSWTSSSWLL